MKTAWTGTIALVLAVVTASAAPLKVKVLKSSVNLRAKPLPTAEVVGQVTVDDVLISKGVAGEWMEITPPAHVDLWILGDYLQNNLIQSSQKVNVRSGPGINFAIVGQLEPGAQVTSRGTVRDWVKIAPPADCSLWVARSLVEVVVDKPPKIEPAKVELPAAEPQPAEKPPAAPPAARERAEAPVALRTSLPATPSDSQPGAIIPAPLPRPSAAPADLDLIASQGQGQWRQYDGVLRPRSVFFRTPSRFRLVSYDQDGNSTTVCYVKGNNDQLATLINRPLIISGREYWVRRQSYPVLIPERIILK